MAQTNVPKLSPVILTPDEFQSLADIIYRKAGIRFEMKKMYFITKRLEKRTEQLGLSTPQEYIRLLRFSDPRNEEFQNFIDLLTVNETYFFRDFNQLAAFAEICLPELMARKAAGGRKILRIWSAGCSTGEEPYTISIILREMVDDLDQWDVSILATDIDRNVFNRAKRGRYLRSSVRDVPLEYLERYFVAEDSGFYRVTNPVKDLVRFEYLNIHDKDAIRQKQGYDFIFCRNVLIYFDTVSRKRVVDHFYVALNQGGYIFLGSSESVSQISAAYKVRRAGNHLVYYKE